MRKAFFAVLVCLPACGSNSDEIAPDDQQEQQQQDAGSGGGSARTDAGSGGAKGVGGTKGTGGGAGAGSGGSTGTGGKAPVPTDGGTTGPGCGTGNPVKSGGTAGVWTRPSIPLASYGDCGAQTTLVDPVRSSDFYGFVCASDRGMTVLKSTDYGETWAKLNQPNFFGNPWGASVNPDLSRSSSTPPTFYSPAGYGTSGVWKSEDGGVTWSRLTALDTLINPLDHSTDAYGVYVLPDDPPNHVMVTFHSNWPGHTGMAESKDGGSSWTIHPCTAGCAGAGAYFIQTAAPGTWLTIGIAYGDDTGTWRTTTCGRTPDCGGAISDAAWTKVDTMQHFHGAFQHYIDQKNGWLYVPTMSGIKRSSDDGATWEQVYKGGWESSVVGTDRYLYANYHLSPNPLIRATRSSGKDWASYTTTPAEMTLAATPYGTALSSDCDKWTIVMGTDDSGIWRYVEP